MNNMVCPFCFHYRPQEDSGICTRFPPTVFPTVQKHPMTGEAAINLMTFHPPVRIDGTCGEWEPSIIEEGPPIIAT